MRVLVADDSRVMRSIVVRTLRQAGFGGWEILQAADGAEALATARDERPDLVLSDWNMPEMNGIDVLRALRAGGSSVPFGFVTSEGSPQMRALAESEGALFLIAKPFDADTFESALRPHVR